MIPGILRKQTRGFVVSGPGDTAAIPGAKDRDLSGIRVLGNRVVAELKDYSGRLLPGPWVDEAEVERGNDDAAAAVVIARRRGTTVLGEQLVLLTVDALVTLLTGKRPT